jgi:uncharacterized Zn finger protein
MTTFVFPFSDADGTVCRSVVIGSCKDERALHIASEALRTLPPRVRIKIALKHLCNLSPASREHLPPEAKALVRQFAEQLSVWSEDSSIDWLVKQHKDTADFIQQGCDAHTGAAFL